MASWIQSLRIHPATPSRYLGDGERILISELVEGLRKRYVEPFGENIDYSVLHKIYGREMPGAPVPL